MKRWLDDLGLGKYAGAFAASDIDRDVLPKLTDDDLKELGLTLGHRRKLLDAIAGLKGEAPARADTRQIQPDAERRQVTVLFCDMVGSTALSQKLDPEDLRGVMRAYQDACAEAIGRYDGHIAQTLGDGLMVYFGYPKAHEDDAARAVRAGMDIVEAITGLDAGQAVGIAVRVGIHTGLVVAGDLGGSDTRAADAIVGETPNVAARLQGMAKHNTVAVSEATHGLTAGTFTWDDLGTRKAKGVTGGIRVYQPTGATEAHSRFEASTAKGITPLVGREEEVALVLDRWGHAKDGEGQVVLLSGEAGIGKSRVTQVLRERIADEAFSHLRMQCSPYYTNSAFYPFIDQFERVAKFARDATPDEKLERMEELLSVGHDDLSVAAPLYAALLSIDAGDRYAPLNMSPQRQKEKTIEAIADQAAGIARHGPVLFIFEDAHWADPTTLDVLEAVIGRIQSSPVLVVITYRPEFEASWTQAHITQLALSRLAKSQCSDMVAKVTGGKALPDEVLAQIVAKTDGVPLFVEELTKTVLEAGFLKDQGDHYELDGPLPPLAIPATLQDSLIARLDRLSPVKEIAQIGAVIGREFSYELMSAVSPLRDNELTDALTELVNSELIFRRGSPPEATYTFKHALVQDAAYESLLKYKRQQLHTAIAKALEEKFPAVKATEPELLAHHYTEAGIYERAVPLWLAAGMFAQKRAAYREAEVRLGHGRDLVQSLPRSPRRNEWGIAINLGLAHALTLMKGYSFPRVGEIFGEAYRLAKEVGDVGSVFTAALGLANFCLFRGEKKKHLRLSKEMLALSEKEKDADFVVTFHSTLAFWSYVSGDALGALEHANATLGLYDPKVHQKLIHRFAVDRSAFALWIAAMAHISLGYPTKALSLSDESVEFAKVLKHTPTLAQVLFIKSGVLVFRREAHGAVRYATEALELSREHGMAYYAGLALLYLGRAEILLHKFSDGIEHLEQSKGAMIGSRGTMLTWFNFGLAEGYGGLGEFDRALSYLDDSLDFNSQTGSDFMEAETYRARGDLLLLKDSGDADGAETSFKKALEIADARSERFFQLRASMSLARLWQSYGKRSEARDLLEPIYDWFNEGFDTADLKDAKALLEELG